MKKDVAYFYDQRNMHLFECMASDSDLENLNNALAMLSDKCVYGGRRWSKFKRVIFRESAIKAIYLDVPEMSDGECDTTSENPVIWRLRVVLHPCKPDCCQLWNEWEIGDECMSQFNCLIREDDLRCSTYERMFGYDYRELGYKFIEMEESFISYNFQNHIESRLIQICPVETVSYTLRGETQYFQYTDGRYPCYFPIIDKNRVRALTKYTYRNEFNFWNEWNNLSSRYFIIYPFILLCIVAIIQFIKS